MSMFDYYQPDPPLKCSRCCASLDEWQGKEAQCGLFLWKQGKAAPIDQCVDSEVKLSEVELSEKRLPEKFSIYSYDCDCGQMLADCTSQNGLWTTCELRVD